jgi:hypothetical protein
MKHYALIFRSTRTFTAEEVQQRHVEISSWVEQVTDMGITLDPRNFTEVTANLSAQESEIFSREGSNDPTLGTIVFFDSPSTGQAVDIARRHPSLRYGVTVEVREWTSPAGDCRQAITFDASPWHLCGEYAGEAGCMYIHTIEFPMHTWTAEAPKSKAALSPADFRFDRNPVGRVSA